MASQQVAHRYARAVLEMAHESNRLDTLVSDMQTIGAAIEGSRDLRVLLASPVIDDRKKEAILAEIFSGRIGDLALHFIRLLAKKGRSSVLADMVDAFGSILDSENKVVRARIRTAVEIDDDQRRRLTDRLSEISGSRITASWIVDPTVIGGFVAHFKDRMIDASVRHQLERLHEAFMQGSMN